MVSINPGPKHENIIITTYDVTFHMCGSNYLYAINIILWNCKNAKMQKWMVSVERARKTGPENGMVCCVLTKVPEIMHLIKTPYTSHEPVSVLWVGVGISYILSCSIGIGKRDVLTLFINTTAYIYRSVCRSANFNYVYNRLQ